MAFQSVNTNAFRKNRHVVEDRHFLKKTCPYKGCLGVKSVSNSLSSSPQCRQEQEDKTTLLGPICHSLYKQALDYSSRSPEESRLFKYGIDIEKNADETSGGNGLLNWIKKHPVLSVILGLGGLTTGALLTKFAIENSLGSEGNTEALVGNAAPLIGNAGTLTENNNLSSFNSTERLNPASNYTTATILSTRTATNAATGAPTITAGVPTTTASPTITAGVPTTTARVPTTTTLKFKTTTSTQVPSTTLNGEKLGELIFLPKAEGQNTLRVHNPTNTAIRLRFSAIVTGGNERGEWKGLIIPPNQETSLPSNFMIDLARRHQSWGVKQDIINKVEFKTIGELRFSSINNGRVIVNNPTQSRIRLRYAEHLIQGNGSTELRTVIIPANQDSSLNSNLSFNRIEERYIQQEKLPGLKTTAATTTTTAATTTTTAATTTTTAATTTQVQTNAAYTQNVGELRFISNGNNRTILNQSGKTIILKYSDFVTGGDGSGAWNVRTIPPGLSSLPSNFVIANTAPTWAIQQVKPFSPNGKPTEICLYNKGAIVMRSFVYYTINGVQTKTYEDTHTLESAYFTIPPDAYDVIIESVVTQSVIYYVEKTFQSEYGDLTQARNKWTHNDNTKNMVQFDHWGSAYNVQIAIQSPANTYNNQA